jgi:hypothetical protein
MVVLRIDTSSRLLTMVTLLRQIVNMSDADYRFLEEHGLTPAQAAGKLRVSRQAVYAGLSRQGDYFDGPRKAELLRSLGPFRGEAVYAAMIHICHSIADFDMLQLGSAPEACSHCIVLPDAESAGLILRALKSQSAGIDRRCRAFKSNISRVIPPLLLRFDTEGAWSVSIQGIPFDSPRYTQTIVLTLAACGLRVGEDREISYTEGQTIDGLYVSAA